jgi:hypothetical protein
MEASLLDMTRGDGVPAFAFTALDSAALEVEIEIVRDDDDDDYDVVVEYLFDRASSEDAFAEPWFAVHEDALAIGEEPTFPPIATRQSLHAVLGFATAVAVTACLYAATM